jgi:hypothetical protein
MEKYFLSVNYSVRVTLLLAFFLLLNFPKASGFGVLTHEAIVDAAWDNAIAPLLKEKFPHATPDELNKAHGYAYGGAIMPDMGYFPFGNIFFTDLMHYTRSGDFVINLLKEAQNLNEYSFALGALAHYTSDRDGHPGAINLSVSMVYPKMRKEFGDTISFEDDPEAHRRMEFGFDVLQVARGKYAPKSYHKFIGFEVSQPSLERAFLLTYGIELRSVFIDLPLAINTFRWSVKTIIPEITNAAWISQKNKIENSQPGITQKQFNYGVSRAQYRKEWGKNYHNPGIGSYAMAIVIKLFPKIWMTRALKFRSPTKEAEALFTKSFDLTVSDYSKMLKKCETNSLHLNNINYDTGKNTLPDEYNLVDYTYKELLLQLPSQPAKQVNHQLRQNILMFYKNYEPKEINSREEKKYTESLLWLKDGK